MRSCHSKKNYGLGVTTYDTCGCGWWLENFLSENLNKDIRVSATLVDDMMKTNGEYHKSRTAKIGEGVV